MSLPLSLRGSERARKSPLLYRTTTYGLFTFIALFALLSVHLVNRDSSPAEPWSSVAQAPSPTSAPLAIPPLPPLQDLLRQTRLPDMYNWAGKAQEHNDRQMIRHWKCTQLGECEGREEMVVLLGAEEYRIGWAGWTGGETIWAMSVFRTMDTLGYTTIVSANLNQTIAMYKIYAPWTEVIIVDGQNSFNCFDRPDCIKQPNGSGIPVWKLFSFHFWFTARHPLGAKWTLCPEPWPDNSKDEPNFDLGYSMESECSKVSKSLPTHLTWV